MSVDMNLANKALEQTKFAMLQFQQNVFVSTLFFNLKFFWDQTIPTACTDGLELRLNPEFFLSLTPKVRISLMNHETWHVAFQHMVRLNGRNPYCWNKACDYVINDMLQKNGYELGSGWLYDKQYQDMSAEQVYDILYQDPNNHSSSSMDDLISPSNSNNPQVTQQIQNTIMKAATAAKALGQGGSLPSSIVQTIEEILTPPVNWQSLFQKFMHKLINNKFDYKKPKRRYFPDFFFPSKKGKGVDTFLVACDSSGSVSDEDLAAFLNQVNIARNVLKPEETLMLLFDTAIRDELKFSKEEKVKYVDFKGRGGTDPECVIEYVNKMKKQPQCLVIFSDMDFDPLDASLKPKCPVIWVSYKAYRKAEVNFGTLVEMPEK